MGQTQKPNKRPTAVDKYNNHASRVRNPNWAVSPYNRFSNFEAKSEKMEDEDRKNVLVNRNLIERFFLPFSFFFSLFFPLSVLVVL